MSKVIKGIKDGSLSVVAFKRVRLKYEAEKQALDPSDVKYKEKLQDITMALQFVDLFLLNYDVIKKGA